MTAALCLNAALSALVFIAILAILAKSIGTGALRPARRSHRLALHTDAMAAVAVPEAYSH
jgi:hypothetical protein